MGIGCMGGIGGTPSLAAQISAMFAGGQQGAWHDPSDFSTLSQDSAGTTSVTAVEQPVGLMRDKSGRNNHASQATAASRPAIGTNARKVINLIQVNTNNNIASNANTAPAPTNNVALTGAPFGIGYGFQLSAGATGFIQRNITIPADTNTYEWSCVVFNTAPGGGAVFRTSGLGINGGAAVGGGVSYNFDTRVGNISGLQVTDLGGNYFHLSAIFPNASLTLFIHRIDSGAGTEKLIFSGQQLLSIPSAVVRKRRLGYSSFGVFASPFNGYFVDGVNFLDNDSQPYSHINAFGDSIVGSGTLNTWAAEFSRYYGEFRNNGVGGETSTQIRTRMVASATTATDIVLIECGRNNPVQATVMADIAAMVATIPHNKYLICSILNRNDQASEQLGGAAYNNIISINNAMAATYPNNYVDIRGALIGAYNPAVPAEVTAFNLSITTARLQPDGLHPSDAGQIAITSAIWQTLTNKGFVQALSFARNQFRVCDGVDDGMTSATGGGGTAGIFICQAIKPTGGAGLVRTLWSDTGTNSGYRVQLDALNQLSFSAGNGVAFTTIASTTATVIGTTHLLTVWDDGVNLNAQLGSGAVATIARPVVTAGTAGFSLGKDNGAATGFFTGNMYPEVYRQTSLTAAERSQVQAYVRSKAGL